MRLRTDIWVSALIRRASAAGAYVTVARKGAPEAGAIFLLVDRLSGEQDLYGPAPQSAFLDAERAGDRLFAPLLKAERREKIEERLVSEIRFDPDLWLVEIEDRAGRPFVALAREES
ncbi:DUF1491 family protein [Afifella pfennigii]|uniref:DUF1491 family protein n=1 Tax=Afifella pfennigii TaxID=209897 RepID=UPI00047CB550|nr:DUF1491 family protein [Afifella pfennigii]